MKALDIWLPAWLSRRRPAPALGVRHLLFCVCDHFEPFQNVGKEEALARVHLWRDAMAALAGEFQDCDGTPPRHTFFYPIEQYDPEVIAALAEICRTGAGEAEIHLHHANDTAENLRRTLLEGKERLASHGLLSRDADGQVRYGFIHGNWALDDSHPEGKACGVRGELALLRETGCYADFTMPSAPDRTQTRTINSLYYAKSGPHGKSHDTGKRVVSQRHARAIGEDELLMVQGPLGLNWDDRKWGFFPRIENGDLTGANPPSADRLRLWLECNVGIENRPNWHFVKLHTHGAKPSNSSMLLGEPMRKFHAYLAKAWKREALKFHYVSAREMVNIIHAAEAGHSGDPGQFRDFRYKLTGSAEDQKTAAVEAENPTSD